MHPDLREIFDISVERLRSDERVVSALNFGSVGKSGEDELSDVDPIFYVRDEEYVGLHAELREIFQGFCPPIQLWWPERGNNDSGCNYAIFFEKNGNLLQYDINLHKECCLDQEYIAWITAQCGPEHILFDKTGKLTAAVEKHRKLDYNPGGLMWWIEQFWIFAYIHVKYLKRAHTFKLLYAQSMLFECHINVLQSLYTDITWSWWPDAAKRYMTPEHQEALLLYFGEVETDGIAHRLLREMDCFSRDAREACVQTQPYLLCRL